MCAVCRGSGLVEAGITGGTVEYGPVLIGKDWRGRDVPTRSAYPTTIRPNPNAVLLVRTGNPKTDHTDIWYHSMNPLCELWGVAICAGCHGTGMSNSGQKGV